MCPSGSPKSPPHLAALGQPLPSKGFWLGLGNRPASGSLEEGAGVGAHSGLLPAQSRGVTAPPPQQPLRPCGLRSLQPAHV